MVFIAFKNDLTEDKLKKEESEAPRGEPSIVK